MVVTVEMKTKCLNMNIYIRKMVVCCCSTQIIIESTALKHRMNFYCLECRKIQHRGHNLTQLEVSFELRDQEFILYSICTNTAHSLCKPSVWTNAVHRCMGPVKNATITAVFPLLRIILSFLAVHTLCRTSTNRSAHCIRTETPATILTIAHLTCP